MVIVRWEPGCQDQHRRSEGNFVLMVRARLAMGLGLVLGLLNLALSPPPPPLIQGVGMKKNSFKQAQEGKRVGWELTECQSRDDDTTRGR